MISAVEALMVQPMAHLMVPAPASQERHRYPATPPREQTYTFLTQYVLAIQTLSSPSVASNAFITSKETLARPTNLVFGPSTLFWNDLGAANSSQFRTITAVWRYAADLNVFLVGADSGMYHKAYRGNSWSPLAGPKPQGGILLTAPMAVAWTAATIDIFVLGRLLRRTWTRSSGWVDWIELGGNWSNYISTVVSWVQGRLDVFVVSSVNHALYHGFVASDGKWQSPKGDPFKNLGGYLTGRPTAVSSRRRLRTGWQRRPMDDQLRANQRRMEAMDFSGR